MDQRGRSLRRVPGTTRSPPGLGYDRLVLGVGFYYVGLQRD